MNETPFAPSFAVTPWVKADYPAAPGARFGHSATFVDSCIYCFGGFLKGGLAVNDLNVLDLDTKKWSQCISYGEKPKPRAFHSAVEYEGTIFIFGGKSTTALFDDMYEYNTKTHTFKKIQMNPGQQTPPRLFEHRAVVQDDMIVVYGGFTSLKMDKLSEEIWTFDLKARVWKKLTMSNVTRRDENIPGPRASHAMVTCDKKIYLVGGIEDEEKTLAKMNDVWELSLRPLKWKQLPVQTSMLPPPRKGMMCLGVGRNFIIAYGSNNRESPSKFPSHLGDIWYFETRGRIWRRLDKEEGADASEGEVPAPRSYAACCAFVHDGHMKVFVNGGEDKDRMPQDDTWLYNVDQSSIVSMSCIDLSQPSYEEETGDSDDKREGAGLSDEESKESLTKWEAPPQPDLFNEIWDTGNNLTCTGTQFNQDGGGAEVEDISQRLISQNINQSEHSDVEVDEMCERQDDKALGVCGGTDFSAHQNGLDVDDDDDDLIPNEPSDHINQLTDEKKDTTPFASIRSCVDNEIRKLSSNLFEVVDTIKSTTREDIKDIKDGVTAQGIEIELIKGKVDKQLESCASSLQAVRSGLDTAFSRLSAREVSSSEMSGSLEKIEATLKRSEDELEALRKEVSGEDGEPSSGMKAAVTEISETLKIHSRTITNCETKAEEGDKRLAAIAEQMETTATKLSGLELQVSEVTEKSRASELASRQDAEKLTQMDRDVSNLSDRVETIDDVIKELLGNVEQRGDMADFGEDGKQMSLGEVRKELALVRQDLENLKQLSNKITESVSSTKESHSELATSVTSRIDDMMIRVNSQEGSLDEIRSTMIPNIEAVLVDMSAKTEFVIRGFQQLSEGLGSSFEEVEMKVRGLEKGAEDLCEILHSLRETLASTSGVEHEELEEKLDTMRASIQLEILTTVEELRSQTKEEVGTIIVSKTEEIMSSVDAKQKAAEISQSEQHTRLVDAMEHICESLATWGIVFDGPGSMKDAETVKEHSIVTRKELEEVKTHLENNATVMESIQSKITELEDRTTVPDEASHLDLKVLDAVSAAIKRCDEVEDKSCNALVGFATETEAKLRTLEELVRDRDGEIAVSIVSKQAKLDAKVTEIQKELSELNSCVQHTKLTDEATSGLVSDVDGVKTSVLSLERDTRSLTEDLGKIKASIKDFSNKLLEQENKQIANEKERERQEQAAVVSIKDTKSSCDELRELLEQTGGKVEELTKATSQTSLNVSNINQMLATHRSAMNAIEEKDSAISKGILELDKDMRFVKDQLSVLEGKDIEENTKKETDKIRETVNALAAKLGEIEGRVSAEENNKRLDVDTSSQQEQAEHTKQLELSVSMLLARFEAQDKRMDDLVTTVKDKDEEIEILEGTVGELRKMLIDVQSQNNEMRHEIHMLKSGVPLKGHLSDEKPAWRPVTDSNSGTNFRYGDNNNNNNRLASQASPLEGADAKRSFRNEKVLQMASYTQHNPEHISSNIAYVTSTKEPTFRFSSIPQSLEGGVYSPGYVQGSQYIDTAGPAAASTSFESSDVDYEQKYKPRNEVKEVKSPLLQTMPLSDSSSFGNFENDSMFNSIINPNNQQTNLNVSSYTAKRLGDKHKGTEIPERDLPKPLGDTQTISSTQTIVPRRSSSASTLSQRVSGANMNTSTNFKPSGSRYSHHVNQLSPGLSVGGVGMSRYNQSTNNFLNVTYPTSATENSTNSSNLYKSSLQEQTGKTTNRQTTYTQPGWKAEEPEIRMIFKYGDDGTPIQSRYLAGKTGTEFVTLVSGQTTNPKSYALFRCNSGCLMLIDTKQFETSTSTSVSSIRLEADNVIYLFDLNYNLSRDISRCALNDNFIVCASENGMYVWKRNSLGSTSSNEYTMSTTSLIPHTNPESKRSKITAMSIVNNILISSSTDAERQTSLQLINLHDLSIIIKCRGVHTRDISCISGMSEQFNLNDYSLYRYRSSLMSPDLNSNIIFATGGMDHKLILWTLTMGIEAKIRHDVVATSEVSSSVTFIKLSSFHNKIFVGCNNGSVIIYNLEDKGIYRSLVDVTSRSTSSNNRVVSLSTNGEQLIVVYSNGTIINWNISGSCEMFREYKNIIVGCKSACATDTSITALTNLGEIMQIKFK